MTNEISTILKVKNQDVRVVRIDGKEYISLTDLARYANNDDPSGVIRNWMSNKNSFDFYSLWENLNNPSFNSVESDGIKTNEVGKNSFTMTPKRWRNKFNAIGIIPSSGKYSHGTFAVPELTDKPIRFVYVEEADVLNVALFGMTAKEWRDNNPDLIDKGNIRDHTDLLYLIILSNLENINAELIKMNISQCERLIRLNKTARDQINLLKNNRSYEELESLNNDVTLKIENK